MAVLIVAVIVVIPATHTVHPTGNLDYGDALVAVGTLALAILTGALAGVSVMLDRQTQQREKDRRMERLSGIAGLMDAEVIIFQQAVETAKQHGEWFFTTTTPHSAWDKHGAEVLQELHNPEDRQLLVGYYTRVVLLETRAQRFFAARPNQGRLDMKAPYPTVQELDVMYPRIRQMLQPLTGHPDDSWSSAS